MTVADLLIQNVRWNGIKTRQRLRSSAGHDPQLCPAEYLAAGDQGSQGARGGSRDACVHGIAASSIASSSTIAPSALRTTRTTRRNPLAAITSAGSTSCSPPNWTIADNVFVGIHGRTGSARGAIFLWHDCRDCIVERNVVVDCDSGICLGNSFKPPEIACHCTDVMVRNNFVTRAPKTESSPTSPATARSCNNTVHDPKSRFGQADPPGS